MGGLHGHNSHTPYGFIAYKAVPDVVRSRHDLGRSMSSCKSGKDRRTHSRNRLSWLTNGVLPIDLIARLSIAFLMAGRPTFQQQISVRGTLIMRLHLHL